MSGSDVEGSEERSPLVPAPHPSPSKTRPGSPSAQRDAAGCSFGAVAGGALALGALAVLAFDAPPLAAAAAGGSGAVSWVTVMLYTLPMALVAGLGGLPFFFVERLSEAHEGIANAAAAGNPPPLTFTRSPPAPQPPSS